MAADARHHRTGKARKQADPDRIRILAVPGNGAHAGSVVRDAGSRGMQFRADSNTDECWIMYLGRGHRVSHLLSRQ